MSLDSKKLRETIKLSLLRMYGIDTGMGIRWHKVADFDPEWLYENLDSIPDSELKKFVKGTIYEDAANML